MALSKFNFLGSGKNERVNKNGTGAQGEHWTEVQLHYLKHFQIQHKINMCTKFKRGGGLKPENNYKFWVGPATPFLRWKASAKTTGSVIRIDKKSPKKFIIIICYPPL